MNTNSNTKKNNLPGIFIMGLISALLAGACVAPVVIAVLLLSAELYAKGDYLSLLLPFFLGAGMALPWPFAGAGLSFLPKPGNWMNNVKKLFAFLILAFAIYYAKQSFELFNIKKTFVTDKPISGIFLKKDLNKAMQESIDTNQPLLIDFWASWCKNCLAMDKTTFQDDNVKKLLVNTIKVKYDATDLKSKKVENILDSFSVKGLPTLIYLMPKNNNDKKQ